MKCILHIGTEKTGSTLLQSWLYSNQKTLSRQGIYLSDNLGKPNNRVFSAYFEHGLNDWAQRNNIRTIEQKDRFFEGFLDRLADEILQASKKHEFFVITSEHLHSRIRRVEDIGAVAAFLEKNFREVKVICYFRDQFDMAVSHYSTALKVSSDDSVESYVSRAKPDNYYFNFLDIADNWSGVFGRENCAFKLYNRAKFPGGDLRKSFVKEVLPGVELSKLNFGLSSTNESLSYLEAAAYRSINRIVPYWDEVDGGMNSLNANLKAEVSKITRLKQGNITSSARKEITDRFENSNRKFFEKYFGEYSGFGGENQKVEDSVAFTIEDVGEIVSNILDAIVPFVHPPGNLEDGDANDLRDIALKIELGAKLSIADALKLMELAKRARPNGPLITRKAAEYKESLNPESDVLKDD